MKQRNFGKIAAAVVAISAFTIAAETVTVGVNSVTLRSGKMSMSPVTATAKNGDTLTVLEKGDVWMKVQAGDTVGWVRAADLDTKSGSINSALHGANAGVNGSASAGALSEGGAGKGLYPGTEEYAKASGNDPSKLVKLQALRQKLINDGTFAKFTKQGNVGAR